MKTDKKNKWASLTFYVVCDFEETGFFQILPI